MVIVYLNTSHVHFFKIYSLWFPKGCRCRVGSKVAKGSCFTILPLIWAKMPLHACMQASINGYASSPTHAAVGRMLPPSSSI